MFRFRAWRTKGALDIMTLILNPLHPVFVAEATGLDLTRPISRADACEINAAMNRYGVLVWCGQPLTAQQQIQFATAFGPLDIGLKRVFKRPERLEDERLIERDKRKGRCEHCRESMAVQRGTRRYCSSACRQAAYRERQQSL
jgi:hypothetical protein